MKEKKKVDLVARLDNKKWKKPNPFFFFLYKLITDIFLLPAYNFHLKKEATLKGTKGPCIIVWNHLSRRDHFFLMEAAWPRPLSILAGHPEHFRDHFKVAFKVMRTLPKRPFAMDIPGVRAMNAIIKQGGVLCMSPEGTSSITGHTRESVAGTGGFLKHYKVPVYILDLRGAYLVSPKHAIKDRKGRIDGTFRLLFSPEQLASMTADEVQEKLDEAMWHDEYEWNKKENVPFECEDGLMNKFGDILYKCPKCGAEFKMHDDGKKLICDECGCGFEFDDKYNMTPIGDVKLPESPSKWCDWERQEVAKEIRANPGFSLSAECELGTTPHDHYVVSKEVATEKVGKGKITLDHKGIHYVGTKNGEPFSFDVSYKTQHTFVMEIDLQCFGIYVDNEYYEIFPQQDKLITHKAIFTCEEMHRYHYNDWKPMKRMAHLYEGMEMGVDASK